MSVEMSDESVRANMLTEIREMKGDMNELKSEEGGEELTKEKYVKKTVSAKKASTKKKSVKKASKVRKK